MNLNAARGLIERASESLDGAEYALRRGHFANATSEAQRTVELSIKAALYAVRVEPPRGHDIHDWLLRHRDAFPPAVRSEVGEWAMAMSELARLREAAAYGEPRAGRTPGAIFFDKRETGRLVGRARSIHESVSGFLGALR
ncbi:MAG TPA: HEPN domain-containing protein [Thermoplasmata archaeon]|nr:HEPN domain-containing protein [Thermoplasmata archaeon]